MKKLGILGGMGPLATCDLFKKVVENTRAGCDNDHIHIIIDNNSAIPDRTAAILKGGADPLPKMRESLQRLTDAGAEVVIMGCNCALTAAAMIRYDVRRSDDGTPNFIEAILDERYDDAWMEHRWPNMTSK